jgi:hypothetical protein
MADKSNSQFQSYFENSVMGSIVVSYLILHAIGVIRNVTREYYKESSDFCSLLKEGENKVKKIPWAFP